MIRAKKMAVEKGQDLQKALMILNSTYLGRISDDAVIRVVNAWAKMSRLATVFINLNDTFRLRWLRNFEDAVAYISSPGGPLDIVKAGMNASDDVGARNPNDYHLEDNEETEDDEKKNLNL